MSDSRIPLYLITGFLDSGKTTLLTDTLAMDYFNDGQRTVLLRCEDGEEEYSPLTFSMQLSSALFKITLKSNAFNFVSPG